MKVILFAPVYSRSGYGDHSREVVSYLLENKKIELEIIPVSWGKNQDTYYTQKNDLIENINKCVITKISEKKYDVCVTIGMPTEFKNIGNFNIGITAGVETNRVSKQFLHHTNKMDLLIVPSNFTRSVFENTKYIDESQNELSLTCEISVVNEYADFVFYNDNDTQNNILSEINEDFCFLSVGQWISSEQDDGGRKNIASLIETFIETFRGFDKKPALVLKTNGCNYSIADKLRIQNKIKNIVNSHSHDENPNIYLLHGELNNKQLYDLYNNDKVKAFVTHTKGEGFGRPLLEAILSGLPIVCPKFGGYLDFLNDSNSSLINGKLLDVGSNNSLFCENAKWIHVDVKKSSKAMIDVFENYNHHKEKVSKSIGNIKENFSKKSAHEKYENIFKNII
tara:strand:- start:10457 stop:11641 length:1185 start_codon:yes stop_codon:yes gene_type:complete